MSIINRHWLMVGLPNSGKTTLFNRMCGQRARSANFPGSTFEARFGEFFFDGSKQKLVDMPGVYSLDFSSQESKRVNETLQGRNALVNPPDSILFVFDLVRAKQSLNLFQELLDYKLPVFVVFTFADRMAKNSFFDFDKLILSFGGKGALCNPLTGKGLESVRKGLGEEDFQIIDRVNEEKVIDLIPGFDSDKYQGASQFLDSILMHPFYGLFFYIFTMVILFWAIFSLASWPMDLIDFIFQFSGELFSAALPDGLFKSLIVDGIIGGLAGTIIFLPQIVLLFFFIALLEESGYLARLALLGDRFLRPFGLPGSAFVPMLSAHACAIPAIMSARLIP